MKVTQTGVSHTLSSEVETRFLLGCSAQEQWVSATKQSKLGHKVQ